MINYDYEVFQYWYAEYGNVHAALWYMRQDFHRRMKESQE